MTPAEFKRKWHRYQGKESSAYQEHFSDLCRLLGQVSVQQLKAIEINPYAFELAQVSVQIGYLQWRRDNGFDNDRSPVLQDLDGFQNEDALLVPDFRSKARTLKEAQAGEHRSDERWRAVGALCGVRRQAKRDAAFARTRQSKRLRR
jgi:hypothetical protein